MAHARVRAPHRGVTLLEMVIVVAIAGMIAALAFPAAASGLESIRLTSASDSVSSFLNQALNLAERRATVVAIDIVPHENTLWLHSTQPGFERRLTMPAGIAIDGDEPRRFLVLPGGTPPQIAVLLANRRGARRLVSVDPVIGAPRIARLPVP